MRTFIIYGEDDFFFFYYYLYKSVNAGIIIYCSGKKWHELWATIQRLKRGLCAVVVYMQCCTFKKRKEEKTFKKKKIRSNIMYCPCPMCTSKKSTRTIFYPIRKKDDSIAAREFTTMRTGWKPVAI